MSSNEAESLQHQIWRVSALLDDLPAEPTTGHALQPLKACFRELARARGPVRDAAEEQIWALWCAHPDPKAAALMTRGIRALSERRLARAEAAFDELVERVPGWAEVWNKRATLYFLQGRDADSVEDIAETLVLEPRHFGALGGFAQISMRNGNPDAARVALECLLRVNPGAPGIAEALATLDREAPKVVH